MRENKRYLLLEGAEREDVEKAILDYIGILGFSRASPQFISRNIVAINREEIDNVRASLALAGKIIKVKRVSGTIKGLSK